MKRTLFALGVFIALGSGSLLGQESANIEYLCADWGPAMKAPAKKGEQPQFSDTEEEIYFLKQVTSIKRTKLRIPDPITGNATKDELAGRAIYLCKMKPDGTNKTEIKELWHNPAYPIDTQAQSTWMDVNEKTHKIALSITLAGSDLTGIWTMGLDGSNLKRVMMPDMMDGHLRSYGSPSWTPDGQWLVFSEAWRGTNYCRIAKCDKRGGQRVYLTEGPVDGHPRVSPEGKQIAFIHWIQKGKANDSWLWLMDLDGSNSHPLPNPQAKPSWSAQAHWGTYPAWSPDGKKIYAVSAGVIDVTTGNSLLRKSPKSIDLDGRTIEQYSNVVMPHWGKLGLLCSAWGGGITLVDEKFETQRILATTEAAENK